MNFSDKLTSQQCLGIFSKTSDSCFIEAAGQSNLDFIIIDSEHGTANFKTIQYHVNALKNTRTAGIVRVSELSKHEIGSVLDAGADGVQIPNISRREEAELAVSYARFYPEGERGVCRFVKAANYGAKPIDEYILDENKKTLILQVEGLTGVDNINEILSVKGFDIVFVGPYDLSQSAGVPGDVGSEKVFNLILKIIESAKKHNKHVGIFCDNEILLRKYMSLGFRYIAYSVDVDLFRRSIQSIHAVLN